MGRLLRKKDQQQKKKESRENTSEESASESSGFKTEVAVSLDSKEGHQKNVPAKKISESFSSLKIKNKYVDQIVQFLREVKVELKKVIWPSRKQATGSTLVVIVLVLLVSIFLSVVDIGLSSLIKAVLR